MVYVFCAHGFEEIEGLTVVDVLRRANVPVKIVGIGGKTITGGHGITVHCDVSDREVSRSKLEAAVFPGGMPGTANLEKSVVVQKVLDYCVENDKIIAAICAAPMILGKKGILKGKKATIFPGMEEHLVGAQYINEAVVVDGKIITGNGPGSALLFGIKLVEIMVGQETASEIGASMQCHQTL